MNVSEPLTTSITARWDDVPDLDGRQDLQARLQGRVHAGAGRRPGHPQIEVCRILAGDEYFSDSLPNIDGDQVRLSMHMKGKWLIEIAELSAMLRADPEGAKKFISQQVEDYIPKYGRSRVIEPRQWVPIGTTNEHDWIRDETGGRRFWPVVCILIFIEKLAAMRDQLIGEAVMLYREGKPWWPDRDLELELFKPKQDARQFTDALAERVLERISTCSEITLAALGSELGFDNTKFDMRAQKRVSGILRNVAKWEKFKRDGNWIWRKVALL